MTATRRVYMGLPIKRRNPLMRQWEVAFPALARGPLVAWLTSAPRPTKPTQQERRTKRKAGETAQKATTTATKPELLKTLRITPRKRGRDGVQTVTSCPPDSAKREKKGQPLSGLFRNGRRPAN